MDERLALGSPAPSLTADAVKLTTPTPETTAFSVLIPGSSPRVHPVDAKPSASVALVSGAARPPPVATTQATARPGTPSPRSSTRRTTSGDASAAPGSAS